MEWLQQGPKSDCHGNVDDAIDGGNSDDVLEDAGDAQDDWAEKLEEHHVAKLLEDLHPHRNGYECHANADWVVSGDGCAVVVI